MQAGSGGGGRQSTLATWRETETLGKFLLNELLRGIQKKAFSFSDSSTIRDQPWEIEEGHFHTLPHPRCGRNRKDSGQMLGVHRPSKLPGGRICCVGSSAVENEL